MLYFYLPSSDQVVASNLLQQLTGFSPDSDPSYLAANGIYTVVPSPSPCDPFLYQSEANYTIAGNYAEQSWTCTAISLSSAQQNGSYQVKQIANTEEAAIVGESGLSTDLLTAVSSQDPLARPARYQDVLDGMTAVSDQLDSNLTAIEAATTVDEINNIVNPPTGVIEIGRGGGGDDDLLATSYVSFNSLTLTESDTELYVPGTATTISYTGSGFPASPNVFSSPDFLIQIREVATSMVIAEFECPLGLAEVNF